MGLPLRFTKNADEEIKAANYPEIRFFTVAGHPAYHHVDVIEGNWQRVSPETASWVSAVGYYFARKVQQEIHVPIGLVVDAVGGTPAESWTSEAALRPLHDFDVPLAELDRLKAENAPEYGNYVMHWYDQYDMGQKNNWAAPDFDDSAWKPVPVPGGFAELGVPDTPALVWFRREITLPDPLPGCRSTPPGPFRAAHARSAKSSAWTRPTSTAHRVGGSAWVENPRSLFHSRRHSEAGAQCHRHSRSQNQARWRISLQARRSSPHARRQNAVFRSRASGKPSSASMLVRRNRCPSLMRTGR